MPNPKKLNVDRQTLTELELFRDDVTGMNVFDLLDKTATSGGRDNLKIIFQSPFTTVNEIIEVQDVLKTISADIEKFQIPFTKKMMDMVEVYYFSKSDAIVSENPIGRFIEGVFYRFKYKDFKETAIDGTKYSLSFLIEFKRYFDRFDPNKLPIALKQLHATVQ
jgi:DNA mismatch repair protein MutS